MKQDQFKNRYIIKLSSSIIVTGLNVIIQLLLPRALPVEEFAYYSYNMNVFTAVVNIINLQVSNGLVAKFSKRNGEIGLVRFYFRFCLLVAVIANIAIVVLYPTSFVQDSFGGQTFMVVLLGLESAFVIRFLQDDISLYDAMAISRFPAVAQIILRVIIAAVVIGGFLLGRLTLVFFYASQVMVSAAVAGFLLYFIVREQGRVYSEQIDKGTWEYAKEYYYFCRPLVLSNVVSQFITIFMNWALMRWSGTAGQAMFGAAWQLNNIVVRVFSPYTELMKREFAVAAGDGEVLRRRYEQALRLVIWITSYFAIFIGFMSDWLLPVAYGSRYTDASLVTLLIMFYTVYQSWGQVQGALQLALEKTRLIAVWGIIGQAVGLTFMFLFQIPNPIWPQTLGSAGIGLAYMCTNILNVTVGIWVNSKLVGSSFIGNFSIQAVPVLLCSGLSVLLKFGVGAVIPMGGIEGNIARVLASGIIYTATVAAVIWWRPQMLGISRESILAMIQIGKFGRKE